VPIRHLPGTQQFFQKIDASAFSSAGSIGTINTATMNPGNDLENMEAVKAQHPYDARQQSKEAAESETSQTDVDDGEYETPTEEEIHTLRRVSGKIPWAAYTIAFVELCERFSYYGTTAVFVNFIQQPLPPGSNTGAGKDDYQSGALDMGQRASTGLTTL
jgi:POT family proton-dependent oligopeptide transporter